jgi:hypothetical protein
VNLMVSVAGHTAEWRFRDSHRLDNWLATRPWLGRNEARVVRITGASRAPEFLACLRRTMRGHDDGASGVAFLEVRADALADGLLPALADVLEVPPAGNRFDLQHRLAERLTEGPTVFLVPPAPQHRPQLLEEAGDWLDRLGKAPPAGHVLLLLADTPRQRLAGPSFDLSVGLPAERLLAPPPGSEEVLWRGYLHHRLAWEAAGDLERVAEWEQAVGAAALVPGNDSDFERQLNRTARARYEDLPPLARQGVREYLEHEVRQTRPRNWLTQRAGQLEQEQLLWRPPGDEEPLVVPWLARALLLAGEVPLCIFHLRTCLVCAPLARELLDRCFDLEARERAALWARRSNRAPPTKAVERWGLFQEPGSFQASLYPLGCPACPDDAWPFATFGEFLTVMAAGDPRRDVWDDLLKLRNHLAHSHYAAWPAVQRLRAIEAELQQ